MKKLILSILYFSVIVAAGVFIALQFTDGWKSAIGLEPTPPATTAEAEPDPAPQQPVPVEDKPKPAFGAQSATLDNGLRVIVIPNHRAPVATHMVWYRAGAMDEVAGKTGLAHFLEHLMFKGSENVPPGAFSKRVRALGGNDNAFTSADFTAYFQNISTEHLDTIMMMEADRMRSITVPPDEFESERQVVLEERRQNTENDPRGVFFEKLRAALFAGHPYATPVIGHEEDIKTLTLEDARAWHQKWYAPNNAIVVLSGDVTLGQVLPLAEKHYGAIPSRPVLHRTPREPDPIEPGTVLTLEDPRIRQSEFIRLYRAPGSVKDKKDSIALDVLREALSGNASTRFYQSFVVEQKLASSVAMGYYADVRDIGSFYIGVTPAEGVSFEAISKALDEKLADVATNGLTEEELNSAKRRMIDSVIFSTDSLSGPARIFGRALILGLKMDDIEYWPQAVEAVSAEDVQAVARRWLAENNAYVTGHIMAASGRR